MLKILFYPLDAIEDAAKTRNYTKILLLQAIVSALFSLSLVLLFEDGISNLVFFFAMISQTIAQNILLSAGIVIFISNFICALIVSFLITVILNIIGGNGDYFKGLASITYGHVAMSIGLIIFVLLNMFGALLGNLIIDMLLLMLSVFIVVIALLIGISTTLRALKELFRTELVTIVIGIIILNIVILLGISFVIVALGYQSAGWQGTIPTQVPYPTGDIFSGSIQNCEEITDNIARDECYLEEATFYLDKTPCQFISTARVADSCYLNIALGLLDEIYCSMINNVTVSEDCSSDIRDYDTAIKYNMMDRCNDIKDFTLYQKCNNILGNTG